MTNTRNCQTITAILAIDFDLFPRRLGKTETYGLSLMDIGGGSYVFSSGFVSSQARFGKKTGEEENFKARRIPRLVALGVARLAATAAVGYHASGRASTVGIGIFLHAGARQTAGSGGTGRWRRLDGNGDRGDVSVRSRDGGALGAWLLQDPMSGCIRRFVTSRGGSSPESRGNFSSIGYLCVYLGAASLGKMFLFSRKDGVGSFGKWLRDERFR